MPADKGGYIAYGSSPGSDNERCTRGRKQGKYTKKTEHGCHRGLIAAFGLDLFLVPSGIIAGGVTGISALASHLTGLHTGMFLFALNLPLLLLAYRRSNREKPSSQPSGCLRFPYARSCSFRFPLSSTARSGAQASAAFSSVSASASAFVTASSWIRSRCRRSPAAIAAADPAEAALRPYHDQSVGTDFGGAAPRLGTGDVFRHRVPDGTGDRARYDFKPSA